MDAARALVVFGGRTPSVVACDMHPGYRSRSLAAALAAEYGARTAAIQHHHAHFASCLAAAGHAGPAIGAILDGTGYGEKGEVWGFEIVSGSPRSVRRHFHLEAVPLPGGDWAVRNPAVSAVAYLASLLGERGEEAARKLFKADLPELEMLLRILAIRDSGKSVPPVSSCGRLFDAVAAITGVCRENTYDGRAPSELCALVNDQDADRGRRQPAPYAFAFAGDAIRAAALFEGILDDVARELPAALVALRFHATVVAMVAAAVRKVRALTGITAVALGGGCWQNEYLLTHVSAALNADGMTVVLPEAAPVNDGGLSLGQAVVAATPVNPPEAHRTVVFAP